MLPSEFPPVKTVYDIYRRWVTAGAWQRINDTLRDRIRVAQGPIRRIGPGETVSVQLSVAAVDRLNLEPSAIAIDE